MASSEEFEGPIKLPRGKSPRTDRWSCLWGVASEKGFSIYPTQRKRREVLVVLLEDLVHVGECRIPDCDENLLILEVTFERVLAIGTPESSRFVTHFVNLSVPRKIFPSSLSDIRIHSEHFLRDHDEHETITPSAMSTLELVDLDKHLQDPVSFPYPVVIRQVSASSGHAVAVTVEGKALVWGEQRDRNFPLLGLGHDQRFKLTTPTEMSTPFGADERVARASCGATTSALVSTRGRAAVWGQVVEVNHDVCGMAKVTQPQLFNPLRSKFVSYIATYAEVCFAVIRVPGVDDVTEVWSWGSNVFGMLGHHVSEHRVFPPHEVESLRDQTIVDLSVSDTHVLCVSARGEVYAWGKNVYTSPKGTVEGILGPTNLQSQTFIEEPEKVQTFGQGTTQIGAVAVQAGSYYSIVLSADKRVYTWGYSGSSFLLGQPLANLQVQENAKVSLPLMYACTPTPVPDLGGAQEIHSNGRVSVCITEEGALYSWGKFQGDPNSKSVINSFSPAESCFVMSCSAGMGRSIVIQGSTWAWIAFRSHRKLISASIHENIGQLRAMVKRVWKCKKRFVIFDALGQYCGPSEPIALLIQRMLLRNVTPAFIVTDVPSLLRIYGDHVSLRDNSLQWADQVSLMSLLFMFPSSVIVPQLGILTKGEIQPVLEMNYHRFFFLNYERLKLSSEDILDFLLQAYKSLDDAEEDEIESWIPTGLPSPVRREVQTQLVRTRMIAILTTFKRWVIDRPEGLLSSSHQIRSLLIFLQEECEKNSDQDISNCALNVRRTLFVSMGRQSELNKEIVGVEGGGGGEGSVSLGDEGSVLLLFAPKLIAEQLTWIDANLVFRTFSAVDLLNQRTPKAVRRHTAVSNWIEKEILECNRASQRSKLIDSIIEILYCLFSLNNYFSYTAIVGGMTSRPIRRLTGNVWEKGTRLSSRAFSFWKTLTTAEVKSKMEKPTTFIPYFCALPDPKIPHLGFFWFKLIYLNEKYKMVKKPPPPKDIHSKEKDQPQKRRWSEDLLLVERSRAESEVVLWIKKVIDLSVELYPHPQNRSLLENLTVVSGFRNDPEQHRAIADSYGENLAVNSGGVGVGVGDDSLEDVDNDINSFLLQNEDSSLGPCEDVEMVLLAGKAQFIALSDRLRNEVWSEWLATIKKENVALKKGAICLKKENVGLKLFDWKNLQESVWGFQKLFRILFHEPPAVHSFFTLFLESEALEVTGVSLLHSFPKEELLSKFTEILSALFANNDLAELIIATIREVNQLDTANDPSFPLSPDAFMELKERALANLLKFLRQMALIHPILVQADQIDPTELIEFKESLLELDAILNEEPHSSMDQWIWYCFLMIDEVSSTLADSSLIQTVLALPDPESSLEESLKVDRVVRVWQREHRFLTLQEHKKAVEKLTLLLQKESRHLDNLIITSTPGHPDSSQLSPPSSSIFSQSAPSSAPSSPSPRKRKLSISTLSSPTPSPSPSPLPSKSKSELPPELLSPFPSPIPMPIPSPASPTPLPLPSPKSAQLQPTSPTITKISPPPSPKSFINRISSPPPPRISRSPSPIREPLSPSTAPLSPSRPASARPLSPTPTHLTHIRRSSPPILRCKSPRQDRKRHSLEITLEEEEDVLLLPPEKQEQKQRQKQKTKKTKKKQTKKHLLPKQQPLLSTTEKQSLLRPPNSSSNIQKTNNKTIQSSSSFSSFVDVEMLAAIQAETRRSLGGREELMHPPEFCVKMRELNDWVIGHLIPQLRKIATIFQELTDLVANLHPRVKKICEDATRKEFQKARDHMKTQDANTGSYLELISKMTKLEIQDDPSALMKRQQTVERKKEKAIHQLSRIPFWESESGSSGEWIVGIEEAKKESEEQSQAKEREKDEKNVTALQFLVQKKRSGSVNKRERELKESTLTSSLRESKREERETGSLSPDPEDSGKRSSEKWKRKGTGGEKKQDDRFMPKSLRKFF